jgi:hypothetical protein
MSARIAILLSAWFAVAPLVAPITLRAEPSGYEYFDPAPVQSTFVASFTPDDLDLYAYAGLRLIEFDVIDAAADEFVGTFIVNEGKYEREWGFSADKSRATMLYESQDPFYIYLDIERTYFHGATKQWHYAVLWVENPENITQVIVADEDYEKLSSLSRYRRPVDLDENLQGETAEGRGPIPGVRYDAVLVDNVGGNAMVYTVSWLSVDQLNAIGQSKHGWVPIDIHPTAVVGEEGKFVGVLVLVPGVKTWWYYDVALPAATVAGLATSEGRLTNIEPNLVVPGTYNATFLIDK